MSLFHGRDVSLNTYQYVFYSYSDKSPNVLQATYYDNTQNLMYSTDISFGSKTVGDMMLFLENSQTNPYALGKDNITPYFRNIDIPFSGLYKKVLTTSHHQLLMSHVNSNYKETYGNAMNIYEVKANGSSNYIIDNISQPDILGSFAGIYVFDQSDSSNSGHILKFRNKSTQTAYEENVTHAGTPGTLNSFTIIEMDYSTPILEYYCEYHSVAMYGEFKILPSYRVKVVTNIVGDSVYALSFPYSSVYYNQPDLSFGAGDYYIFDVSDPTMANYNLVFGTIADDATTINNSVVSETNGVIILDIPSGYSGSPLVLFDLSNANMGYVGYSSGVTPVVRLDFGLESDYTNLTNQVDGTQYTDISYTGGLSLNNDELEIAQQNNVTFSNLPPEQFTIMLTYKFTTSNQYWHGISFKQENNNYTVFMHQRSSDTQYNLVTMKQDNSPLFTFGSQGYPGQRVYDIGTQYSFAYVKTDTSLNFFENQSLISSISNDFSLNEFWVNREGNADTFNTDIAIADVKIFDTAVDVPNYVDNVDNVTSYIVTVSNEVFYIDDVEKLEIAFVSSNIYVFDQSDATNAGQQIVFGYTFDSSNIFVSTDGVQVVGTPGQPGAYTSFTVPSNPSGTIHYYSDGSANMGYLLVIEDSYVFSVKHNVFDEPVWALYNDTEAVWYNQPDLSFSAPYIYEFDVSDPSNNGYVLSFGTTVDVSDETIESTYVIRTNTPGTTGAKVLLKLENYSGDSLVYFEDTSAGMGYVETELIVETLVQTGFTNTDVLSGMNALTYTLSGNSNSFANGTYVLFASSYSQEWGNKLYNILNYSSGAFDWHTDSSTISSVDTTAINNGLTYSGVYIELTMPYRMLLTQVNIKHRTASSPTSAKEVSFLGSNDSGSTFYFIEDFTLDTSVIDVSANFSSSNTEHYSTIRMVVRETQNGGIDTQMAYWGLTGDVYEQYEAYDSHYTVTVNSQLNAFILSDSSANPQIDFSANNSYLFDQSDPTNEGQQIVFGYTFDDSANILTPADGVTIMGTPGRPGAYTTLDLSSSFVGPLYYYSDGSANMGFFIPVDISYSFTVQTNVIGDNVWSVYDTSNAVWYNQPDLSFSAPYVYEFDVSDPSNNGYVLSFGTTVDVSDATIESTYVTRTNVPGRTEAKVLLDLRNYSGANLVYFEDTSAGMGYTDIIVTPIIVTYNSVFYLDGVQAPYFYFEADTTYIFDQSHTSNTGNQIVFGPDYDNIYTIDSGVTIIGTPGQSGAYTKLVLSSSYVGPIYYYSYNNTGKGSGPQFHLVFVQSNGYWMSDPLSTHTGYTDVNNQYSIFHKMNNTTYLKYGNTYRWKYYISASKYIIWEQSNNFLNDNTVTGFKIIQNVGITSSNNTSSFSGLSETDQTWASMSQYDLTADHSNFWFAIGQKTEYNGQITLDYTTGDKVELYAYY